MEHDKKIKQIRHRSLRGLHANASAKRTGIKFAFILRQTDLKPLGPIYMAFLVNQPAEPFTKNIVCILNQTYSTKHGAEPAVKGCKRKVISHEHIHNSSQPPLQAMLGLDQQPARPMQRDKFFFASPLISQRLAVLNRLICSLSPIVVIIGEKGSGKTTFLNRLIHDGQLPWKVCRIRLKPKGDTEMAVCRNLNNRLVFLTKKAGPPSVVIDDAHELSRHELKILIQASWPGDRNRSGKFQNIVLFAEPQIRKRLADIAEWLPPNSVIEKIHMTPLTEEQTADYLRHRIKMAGLSERDLFSIDQIRLIYKQSGGLPGWINQKACMLLQHRAKQHLVQTTVRPKIDLEHLKDSLRSRMPRMFKT